MFAALYRARAGAVSRYVGSILRDVDRSQDVVAETFLLAWRDLRQLRQVGRFDAWLFRIAHHQVVRELRRRPVAPLADVPERAEGSRYGNPVALLEGKIDAERLRSALLVLPETQRQVLVLRYFEQLSHAQVARQMGKSEQAVRALQQRGLKRMRQAMDGTASKRGGTFRSVVRRRGS